jgi:hypothetical protein
VISILKVSFSPIFQNFSTAGVTVTFTPDGFSTLAIYTAGS